MFPHFITLRTLKNISIILEWHLELLAHFREDLLRQIHRKAAPRSMWTEIAHKLESEVSSVSHVSL